MTKSKQNLYRPIRGEGPLTAEQRRTRGLNESEGRRDSRSLEEFLSQMTETY